MTHHIKELYTSGVRLHPVLWSWPSRKIMPRISGTRSITPQTLKVKQDCLNESHKLFKTGHPRAQDLCARSSGILYTVPQARIGKISQNVFT
ncbi:hypothetical protein Hanom_Chr11g01050101 [Helianthus anomalus]